MIEPAVACLLIGHENSGIGTFLSGKSRHAQESRTRRSLAPRARFELATLRLTAECSTVELPGIRMTISSNSSKLRRVPFNGLYVRLGHMGHNKAKSNPLGPLASVLHIIRQLFRIFVRDVLV